jgi:hypothetical protein
VRCAVNGDESAARAFREELVQRARRRRSDAEPIVELVTDEDARALLRRLGRI